MVSTVMDCVDLEKTRFSLVPGIMNPDGDGVFQPFSRAGTGNTPEWLLFPFLFELPVDGRGTDGKELSTHEAEIFPEGFEGGDDLRAVDNLARSFFRGFLEALS
jgi:hypothetical protein